MNGIEHIGLLGFGEVGQILAAELGGTGSRLLAFDLKFSDPFSSPSKAAQAATQIVALESARALALQSQIIFSAVTAEQTEAAVEAVADHLQAGAWFIDLNSAAPATKQKAATDINRQGGRYVEVAIMSPFPAKRLGTPLLLGGEYAREFQSVASSMGWSNTQVFSQQYGPASAAKMCRSVMVKGVEALLVESLVAARAYGVEQTVLTSLQDLFPGPEWAELARYMIGRTLEHGERRAEEMREVAKTVSGAALDPRMSLATVAVQDWAKDYPQIQNLKTLDAVLDALVNVTRLQKKGTVA